MKLIPIICLTAFTFGCITEQADRTKDMESDTDASIKTDMSKATDMESLPDMANTDMKKEEPTTYEAQIKEYGFGIKILDAYYLEQSAAGTRLVVTVDIVNESEPTKIQLNLGFASPGYVETKGAGNIDVDRFTQDNFKDEYEEEHSWCIGNEEISKGGSLKCSLFFFQQKKSFDSVNAMVLNVVLRGTFEEIPITTKFEMNPRLVKK